MAQKGPKKAQNDGKMDFPRSRSKMRGNWSAAFFVPNTNSGTKKKTEPKFDTPGPRYVDLMVKKNPLKWPKKAPERPKMTKKWISREIEAKLEEIGRPYFLCQIQMRARKRKQNRNLTHQAEIGRFYGQKKPQKWPKKAPKRPKMTKKWIFREKEAKLEEVDRPHFLCQI